MLAPDMVAREEMIIRPKKVSQLERTLGEETRHISLLAAYRDLDQVGLADKLCYSYPQGHND